MNKLPCLFLMLLFNLTHAQKPSVLKMESEASSKNVEIMDVLRFEGIDYMKLKFSGADLKGKRYHISVKEIWDGKVRRDTTVFDSRSIGIEQFEKINDTIFTLRVISKLTDENKLKMTFTFPRFSVSREFDAIESDDYSLRNIAEESNLPIAVGKKFYLLAYILPYERPGGGKSWCDVGESGKDLENWGKKFGIKHYLLFEMLFD